MRVERPADWETLCYAQLNHKLSTLNHFRTPPPAAPPLSALYARQRRTLLRIHLQQRTTTYLPASPTYQPTPLNLSTLNPQPSTHLRHKKPLHCRSSARQHRGKPHQLLSRNGRLSLPCPKQFIPCMRFGFRKTCKPLSRPSDAVPPDRQFIPSLPPNIQTLS